MNYAQDCRSVFHDEACRIRNRAWTVGELRDYQEAWRTIEVENEVSVGTTFTISIPKSFI